MIQSNNDHSLQNTRFNWKVMLFWACGCIPDPSVTSNAGPLLSEIISALAVRHPPLVRAEGRMRHVLTFQLRIRGKTDMWGLPWCTRHVFGQIVEGDSETDFEKLRRKEPFKWVYFSLTRRQNNLGPLLSVWGRCVEEVLWWQNWWERQLCTWVLPSTQGFLFIFAPEVSQTKGMSGTVWMSGRQSGNAQETDSTVSWSTFLGLDNRRHTCGKDRWEISRQKRSR